MHYNFADKNPGKLHVYKNALAEQCFVNFFLYIFILVYTCTTSSSTKIRRRTGITIFSCVYKFLRHHMCDTGPQSVAGGNNCLPICYDLLFLIISFLCSGLGVLIAPCKMDLLRGCFILCTRHLNEIVLLSGQFDNINSVKALSWNTCPKACLQLAWKVFRPTTDKPHIPSVCYTRGVIQMIVVVLCGDNHWEMYTHRDFITE